MNKSNAPIRINYGMRVDGASGAYCRIESVLPRVAVGSTEDENWNDLRWIPASGYQYDGLSCEMALELPAGSTALIDEYAVCGDADVRKVRSRNPDWRPMLNRLAIEGRARKVVFVENEVPLAFKKSVWRDTCTLVYE